MLAQIRKRIRGEDGLSLIEMLVALMVVSIVMLAFLGTLTASAKGIIDQRMHATATRVASEHLEDLRSQVWSNLALYDFAQLPRTWTETVPVGEHWYTIDTTVRGLAAGTAAAGTDVKEVAATVTWTAGTVTRSLQVSTIVGEANSTDVNPAQLLVEMDLNPTPATNRGDGYFSPDEDIAVSVTLVSGEYTGQIELSWTNHDGTSPTRYLTTQVGNTWTGTIPSYLIAVEWPEDKLDVALPITVSAGTESTIYELNLFGYNENEVYLFDYTVTPDPVVVYDGTRCGYVADNRTTAEMRIQTTALPDDIATEQITVQVWWDGTPNSTLSGVTIVPVTLTRDPANPRLWEGVLAAETARLQPGTRTFTLQATSTDPRAASSTTTFTHEVEGTPETGMPAGSSHVYTASEDDSVRKYETSALAQQWSWSPAGADNWFDVAVDGSNVYVAGQDRTIRKLDLNGNLVWTYSTFSDQVFGVAVGRDGYVYSASKDHTVKKLTPAGVLVWSVNLAEDMYDVAVDVNGNVYAGGNDKKVTKLTPSGTIAWQVNAGELVYAVAVDTSGNVIGGVKNTDVRKWDSSGNPVWTNSVHANDVFDVAIDASGNVYSVSQDKTVRKYNSSGTLQWTYTGPREFESLAVGTSGNVYVGDWEGDIRKLSSAGALLVTKDQSASKIKGIDVSPGKLAVAGHCS